jgi:hypothetical protein
MGEIWSDEELARKNEMLGDDAPLSREAQIALDCAECILARPVPEDAPEDEVPGFTAPEIQRCTALKEFTVRATLEPVVSSGYLTRIDYPAARIYGNKRKPRFFTPTPLDPGERNGEEGGEGFFRPESRPGCDRTAEHFIMESFTDSQLAMLACMVCRSTIETPKGSSTEAPTEAPTEAEIEESKITVPNVRDCTGQAADSVRVFVNTLSRYGAITTVADFEIGFSKPAEYALNKKAEALFPYVEPLESCRLREPDKPPKDPTRVSEQVLEKIRQHYPDDMRPAILARISGLLKVRFLQMGEPSDDGQLLQYDRRVTQVIGKPGQIATAHWLGIDPLLYGQRLQPAQVLRLLGLSDKDAFARTVKSRFFDPAMTRLSNFKD